MTERPDNGGAAARRLLDAVADLVRELHPGRAATLEVGLDSSLERDLGLDSLGRVELMGRLESAFGVGLGEQVLTDAETPRDLLRAVLGAEAATGKTTPDIGRIEVDTGIAADIAPRELDTLIDVLKWHVTHHPDHPHIRLYSDDDEGEVITYGDLWAAAGAVAAGLQNLNIGHQRPVAIMLPTGADYFAAFIGVLMAGAVPVSVYPPARISQVEEHLKRQSGIFDNCRAAVLISTAEAVHYAPVLKAGLESLEHVVTVADLASSPGRVVRPVLKSGDTAFLQYTSGSTGNPKGVVLSHANLLANIRVMGDSIGAGPDDVFISWLPLYHDMGLIGAWLGSLYFATPLVIMSPLSFLARPRRWLWAIHRFGGTLSAAPNFAYEMCLNKIRDADIEGLDLSSWRLAFNGAEAISPLTVNRFCDRFAAYGFRREAMFPVYGLAESSVGLAFPPTDRGPLIDHIDRTGLSKDDRADAAVDGKADTETVDFVACGQPLPGHEIRIVDTAGRELPERRQGRLQFRGPSTTGGYYHNPEQTEALFDGDWLDSGDLAYIAGGDVFITGRIKDVIIRAGRNIYPVELEEAVGDIDGIRKGNVAIFASPDVATGTERLIVLAETRKRHATDVAAIEARITALAIDLIGAPPDDVVLAPPRTVLKTSSGKIRRSACREVYERGLIGAPRPEMRWQMLRLTVAGIVPWMRRAVRVAGAGLFAAWAWTLIGSLAAAAWVVAAALPVESWRWPVLRLCIRSLGALTATRLTVSGLDNLPPPGQPMIFAANHASYLDGFVLTAALGRMFSFVAKAELQDSFVSRILLRRIGAEFVERVDAGQGIEDAKRVTETARAGRALLFFPEGTLMRMPGLLPFHMGAFTAAVAAEAPVLPVTIRGTRSMLRGGTWFPRPGNLSVVIGAPVEPDTSIEGDWSRAVDLRDRVRAEILSRSGEPDLELEKPPV
ncbi:MAG: AMP-binding protein [Alphaproteobacteria bacterium]